MKYEEFLKTKESYIAPSGFKASNLNIKMFNYQRDIVSWAVRKGKAAIFADCGMGKTLMQLEYARQVCNYTGGDVLIVAPLSVATQTKDEGSKFGYNVNIVRSQEEVSTGINITNYEMLWHFNADKFQGVILDESSILKSFTGKTKQEIIDKFKYTPYKLACTATPAPNDFVELGNHAEFLNIMSRSEMLATYFVHDGGDTSKWRLKGHAEDEFWKWIASWACVITKPSDLGYSDEGFVLPDIKYIEHIVSSEADEGLLCASLASTLSERRDARKNSMQERVKTAAEICEEKDDQFVVWCDFNAESQALAKAIEDSIEVCGADSPEYKAQCGMSFARGDIKVIISKPSIYGFGMNWQNCHDVIFCGLSDSYEQFYQAVRRCYRYGQKKTVNAHIIISEKELNVLDNIKRKSKDVEKMKSRMIELTKEITTAEIHHTSRITQSYIANKKMTLPSWVKGA